MLRLSVVQIVVSDLESGPRFARHAIEILVVQAGSYSHD